MPEAAIYLESKKFMWDGEEYASSAEAKARAGEYSKENFEVHVAEEEGKTYLYTRREVTEVVVEGQPPA